MTQNHTLLEQCIQKVATGYEYSRNLSRTEASDAMRSILSGEADDVQAAIFLIALRMKREIEEENLGIQDAVNAGGDSVSVSVPHLCAISDPYDGLLRSVPVSVFLPATLAACGLPAYSHGVERLGPKYGVTHAQILKSLGYCIEMDLTSLAAQLADPEIGWVFVGLKQFNPGLDQLAALRHRMVKRTALSTIERAHRPFKAIQTDTLLTGYVHKAYPDVYLTLARNSGFARAITYRGYEGGVIPPLHQKITIHSYSDGGEKCEHDFSPTEFGIKTQIEKTAAEKDNLKQLLESGMAALRGDRNVAYQSLLVAGAIALVGAGIESKYQDAIERVKHALDQGKVLARFEYALEVSQRA